MSLEKSVVSASQLIRVCEWESFLTPITFLLLILYNDNSQKFEMKRYLINTPSPEPILATQGHIFRANSLSGAGGGGDDDQQMSETIACFLNLEYFSCQIGHCTLETEIWGLLKFIN